MLWMIVLYLIGAVYAHPKETETDWKAIVIMIDGCRWDYVKDPDLKGFAKLAKNGVKAEYVKPVFPSNSYPNWYSIVTGLYSESHGFVQNIMYDEEKKEFFTMLPNPNSTNAHWWEKAEPIWVTAEKMGIKTAMYWCAGCGVLIHGVRPTYYAEHRYTSGGPNITKDILNKAMDMLNKFHQNKIKLAALYYGAVDNNGHNEGPDAPETRNALLEIDKVLDELQNQISLRGLSNQVHLIVVSDHGMTNTDLSKVQKIDLEPFAHLIKYMLYKGSSTMILPEDGFLNKLYDSLKAANIKGLQIFKKNEIPEKYHFKRNKLVLPLFLLADKGYYIKPLLDSNKTLSNSTKSYKGFHGYDPDVVEDMRTIFYARGPLLKKNYVSPSIENVDHYNLFCDILKIKPLPNNGSRDRIKDMYYDPTSAPSDSSTFKSRLFLLAMMIIIVTVPYFC